MKVLALIFMSIFLHLSDGYVFTEKPEETTWGIQGEPLQLQCVVDESWQAFFYLCNFMTNISTFMIISFSKNNF